MAGSCVCWAEVSPGGGAACAVDAGAVKAGGAVFCSAVFCRLGAGNGTRGTGLCFFTILWSFSGAGTGTGGLGAGAGGAATAGGSTGSGSGWERVCAGPGGASVGGAGTETGLGARSMAIAAGAAFSVGGMGAGRSMAQHRPPPLMAHTASRESPHSRVSRCCSLRSSSASNGGRRTEEGEGWWRRSWSLRAFFLPLQIH